MLRGFASRTQGGSAATFTSLTVTGAASVGGLLSVTNSVGIDFNGGAGGPVIRRNGATGNLDIANMFAEALNLRDGHLMMKEQTAPSAPAADCVRIYAVDNGSGKTQLMALFSSGAAQQLAIQP